MISPTSHIADSVVRKTTSVPLDGLYEPPPVPFTFEAVGWSILAGVIGVILLVWCMISIYKYIKNRYRREAVAKVRQLESDPNGVLVILKQVAIYKYGREEVASLSGVKWLQFLDKTGSDVQFSKEATSICNMLYAQESVEIATARFISQNTIKWIQSHA